MSQPNQANTVQTPAQTDVRRRVEEIVKNIGELNQQVTKLKEVVRSRTLDDELTRLRNIIDDMDAWLKKLKTYFSIHVLDEGHGQVIVKGRDNEVEWVRSYGSLDDLMINKILDDFFDDARYFNNALKVYTKTIERITHLLPGMFTVINEVRQQLSGLEGRVSEVEDEVEELKDRLDDP